MTVPFPMLLRRLGRLLRCVTLSKGADECPANADRFGYSCFHRAYVARSVLPVGGFGGQRAVRGSNQTRIVGGRSDMATAAAIIIPPDCMKMWKVWVAMISRFARTA